MDINPGSVYELPLLRKLEYGIALFELDTDEAFSLTLSPKIPIPPHVRRAKRHQYWNHRVALSLSLSFLREGLYFSRLTTEIPRDYRFFPDKVVVVVPWTSW
jgi:hypothetical protein